MEMNLKAVEAIPDSRESQGGEMRPKSEMMEIWAKKWNKMESAIRNDVGMKKAK